MTSMTRLRRRLDRWARYADKATWDPERADIPASMRRAWLRHDREKLRRNEQRTRPTAPNFSLVALNSEPVETPPARPDDALSWWWMLPVVAAPVLAFALAWWVTK